MTGEFFCFILFFWFWLFCVLKASYGIGILFPNSGKFSVMNLLKMFPVPLEWDFSPIHIMSKTGLVECHVWSAHYTFLLVFLCPCWIVPVPPPCPPAQIHCPLLECLLLRFSKESNLLGLFPSFHIGLSSIVLSLLNAYFILSIIFLV